MLLNKSNSGANIVDYVKDFTIQFCVVSSIVFLHIIALFLSMYVLSFALVRNICPKILKLQLQNEKEKSAVV